MGFSHTFLQKTIARKTVILASLGIASIILLLSFFFLSPNATFAWIISRTGVKTPPPGQITKNVIFIPGLELTAKDYATIITNLKKNGYTISAYTPTYENTDDYNKMIDVWTDDIKKMVGEKKVIVIGHSVGGAVATHFCSQNTHCIAGINMDGLPAYNEKLSVPFLYLQAGVGAYCDEQCINGRKRMTEIAKNSGSVIVQIPDIKHFNFTDKRDVALYTQDFLGKIDGRDIINNEIMKFLHETSYATVN